MAKSNQAPIIENPQLIDKVLGQIQTGLIDQIGWLDVAYGRAQRLVKEINGKKYFTPNVYSGKNKDYVPVSPDSHKGNFSFFWIDDPQNIDWIPNQQGAINTRFSIIFWMDLRKVLGSANDRNTEVIKIEILKALNGRIGLTDGRISISRIYEQAENIYKGFSLDEITNQFLMHPYYGFRFEGDLFINEPC